MLAFLEIFENWKHFLPVFRDLLWCRIFGHQSLFWRRLAQNSLSSIKTRCSTVSKVPGTCPAQTFIHPWIGVSFFRHFCTFDNSLWFRFLFRCWAKDKKSFFCPGVVQTQHCQSFRNIWNLFKAGNGLLELYEYTFGTPVRRAWPIVWKVERRRAEIGSKGRMEKVSKASASEKPAAFCNSVIIKHWKN